MLIGYHASHEQMAPSALLQAVTMAELAGFDAAMCSDHFAPWSVHQGHSGHAWTWLGAALARTRLRFGVVNAPGQRYHPAVIAQAIATLAEMFPGRFWAALGSGEALNEHITGDAWPAKPERDVRLEECAHVIRRLLAGDTVDHHGLVTVDRARLWSLPTVMPSVVGAAISAETAARVATWADGLITVNRPIDELGTVVRAFREHGGDGKPVAVQMHLAWDEDERRAEAVAVEQWGTNALPSHLLADLSTPEEFDEHARDIRIAEVRRCGVVVSADLDVHVAAVRAIESLGVDEVYLHHVGTNQEQFIREFGHHVLPRLREGRG